MTYDDQAASDERDSVESATRKGRDVVGLWSIFQGELPARIHILSDIHLDGGPYEIPADLDFDLLIAAGDIGPLELAIPWLAGIGRPVVYVLGNHEYYGQDLHGAVLKAKAMAVGTRVHVLERDSVVVHGVRFIGGTLWTDFGDWSQSLVQTASALMRDYREIRVTPSGEEESTATSVKRAVSHMAERRGRMLRPRDVYEVHRDTLAYFSSELSKADDLPTIVVTHHGPSYACLKADGVLSELIHGRDWWRLQTHPSMVKVAAYASALEPYLARQRGRLAGWVHGHIHTRSDLIIEGVRVISNPRGYPLGPMSKERVEQARWYGIRYSADELERGNRRYDEDPYAGDGIDFERHFVFNVAEGFGPPLAELAAGATKKIVPLIRQCEELRAYLNHCDPVLRNAVRRTFSEDVERAEMIVHNMRVGAPVVFQALENRPLPEGIKVPMHLPLLRSYEGMHAEPGVVSLYDRAIVQMAEWSAWLTRLPNIRTELWIHWLRTAVLVLEWLGQQGIEGKVLSPTWRSAFDYSMATRMMVALGKEPVGFPGYRELDSLLERQGSKGFEPIFNDMSEDFSPDEIMRLMTKGDLEDALRYFDDEQ